MNALQSPCIRVCVLDPASGYCLGCGRTADEVAQWVAMGHDARQSVLAALPHRMDGLAPAPPASQSPSRRS